VFVSLYAEVTEKNFQARVGSSKHVGGCKITYTLVQLTGAQGAQTMNCWECDLVGDVRFSEEGAQTTDTSVSTWNFNQYWNSSASEIQLGWDEFFQPT